MRTVKTITYLLDHYDYYFQTYLKRTRTISEIEHTYCRLKHAQEKHWQNIQRPLIKAIFDTGGRAHALPENSKQNNGNWWLYRVEDNQKLMERDEEFLSYSFDWVSKPKKLNNQKLGQKLYRAEKRNEVLTDRACKVKNILANKLESYLYKNHYLSFADFGRIIDVVVNGRSYIYIWALQDNHRPGWKNLSWGQEIERVFPA